jgi:hypothetical protein
MCISEYINECGIRQGKQVKSRLTLVWGFASIVLPSPFCEAYPTSYWTEPRSRKREL